MQNQTQVGFDKGKPERNIFRFCCFVFSVEREGVNNRVKCFSGNENIPFFVSYKYLDKWLIAGGTSRRCW